MGVCNHLQGGILQRAKGKGQRAKGKGQRAKGKGQRAKGKGQISKIYFILQNVYIAHFQ